MLRQGMTVLWKLFCGQMITAIRRRSLASPVQNIFLDGWPPSSETCLTSDGIGTDIGAARNDFRPNPNRNRFRSDLGIAVRRGYFVIIDGRN